MESRARERIEYVVDTMHGAQGDEKSVKGHLKDLQKQAGVKSRNKAVSPQGFAAMMSGLKK